MRPLHAARAKMANATTRKTTIAKSISAEYSDYKDKLERLSSSLGKMHNHITNVDQNWTNLVNSQRDFANDFHTDYPQTDPVKVYSSSAQESVHGILNDISSPKEAVHPTKSESARILAYKKEVDDLLDECPQVELKYTETSRYDAKTDKLAKKSKDDSKISRNMEKRDSARHEFRESIDNLVARMRISFEKSPAIYAGAQSAFWHVQEGASGVVAANSHKLAVGSRKAALSQASAAKSVPASATKEQVAEAITPAPTTAFPSTTAQEVTPVAVGMTPPLKASEMSSASDTPFGAEAASRDIVSPSDTKLNEQSVAVENPIAPSTSSTSVPPEVVAPVALALGSDPVTPKDTTTPTVVSGDRDFEPSAVKSAETEDVVNAHEDDLVPGAETGGVLPKESVPSEPVKDIGEPMTRDVPSVPVENTADTARVNEDDAAHLTARESAPFEKDAPVTTTPASVVAGASPELSPSVVVTDDKDMGLVSSVDPVERDSVVKKGDVAEPSVTNVAESTAPRPTNQVASEIAISEKTLDSPAKVPEKSDLAAPKFSPSPVSPVVKEVNAGDLSTAPVEPEVSSAERDLPADLMESKEPEPATLPLVTPMPKDETSLVEEADVRKPATIGADEKSAPVAADSPLTEPDAGTTKLPVSHVEPVGLSTNTDGVEKSKEVPVNLTTPEAGTTVPVLAESETVSSKEVPVESHPETKGISEVPAIAVVGTSGSREAPAKESIPEIAGDGITEKAVDEVKPLKVGTAPGSEAGTATSGISRSKSTEKTKLSTRVGDAFRKRKSLFSRKSDSVGSKGAAKDSSPTREQKNTGSDVTAGVDSTPVVESSNMPETGSTREKVVEKSLTAKAAEKTSRATDKGKDNAEEKIAIPSSESPDESVQVAPEVTPATDTASVEPGNTKSKPVDKVETAMEKVGAGAKEAAEKISASAKKRKSLFSRNKSKKDLSPTS